MVNNIKWLNSTDAITLRKKQIKQFAIPLIFFFQSKMTKNDSKKTEIECKDTTKIALFQGRL